MPVINAVLKVCPILIGFLKESQMKIRVNLENGFGRQNTGKKDCYNL